MSATEPFQEAAAFQRRVHEHGHRLALHSGTRTDIERDTKDARRDQSLQALNKYLVLDGVPASPSLLAAFGASANDQVDALIASALEANAAHYLVTEDRGLGQRLGRVAPLAAVCEDVIEREHRSRPRPEPLWIGRPVGALEHASPAGRLD